LEELGVAFVTFSYPMRGIIHNAKLVNAADSVSLCLGVISAKNFNAMTVKMSVRNAVIFFATYALKHDVLCVEFVKNAQI
jgi:hypothetical protein